MPLLRATGAQVTRLSAAQLMALTIAASRPIVYYKGGWYTCEPGSDALNMQQRSRRFDPAGDVTTNVATLNACVRRGWITRLHAAFEGDIYRRKWAITETGRAALKAATP